MSIGGWDATLRAQNAQGCEDWRAYLRLAEIGDFALAPGFLTGYRQTVGAMSRQIRAMTRSHRLVLAEARARHPNLPRALFRWSLAAFDFYHFELLCGMGIEKCFSPLIGLVHLTGPSMAGPPKHEAETQRLGPLLARSPRREAPRYKTTALSDRDSVLRSRSRPRRRLQ